MKAINFFSLPFLLLKFSLRTFQHLALHWFQIFIFTFRSLIQLKSIPVSGLGKGQISFLFFYTWWDSFPKSFAKQTVVSPLIYSYSLSYIKSHTNKDQSLSYYVPLVCSSVLVPISLSLLNYHLSTCLNIWQGTLTLCFL